MSPPSATPILNDGNVVIVPPSKISSTKTSNSSVLHRTVRTQPPLITSAEGLYVTVTHPSTSTTSAGKTQTILDATGGPAVSCLGYGNERVKAAVAKQQDEVSFAHSMFFGTKAGEDLGDELIRGTNGEMGRCFIVCSGSEAMEAAMKLARQFYLEQDPPQSQRTRFIARKESYHGTTIGALSMGGHVARRAAFEPMLLDNVSHVSACNAYRGMLDSESIEEYAARLAQELDDEFVRVGADKVCAFVAEPVVGAALGCVPAVPGYFKAMKKVCDKYGALLILDEVMCGMGRTGTLHAWQHEGVVPDIQTIGKGLGAGYAAVAGLLIKNRVVDALGKGTGAFAHGQTYQGHPIACAAALEVQKIIREEGLVENAREMGILMEVLLKKRLGSHPHVGDIRGRGLFWGIEFVEEKATKKPFEPSEGIAMGINTKGMEEKYSISLYPGTGTVDGKYGDHVILSPAYTVTKADVELIVDRASLVIEDFFAERK